MLNKIIKAISLYFQFIIWFEWQLKGKKLWNHTKYSSFTCDMCSYCVLLFDGSIHFILFAKKEKNVGSLNVNNDNNNITQVVLSSHDLRIAFLIICLYVYVCVCGSDATLNIYTLIRSTNATKYNPKFLENVCN